MLELMSTLLPLLKGTRLPMNWVRLFTDSVLKYSVRNSPIGFDSFIETAWGFFCNSAIISPRQQTAAQKPFSRQALVQSGVMFFNILKIMRRVYDP